ncbi:MAG: sulfatase-like hydrolase/transferase [Dehalococcoidia bacterium]|jgi:choline-sulfatase|nr:sulfatase-like hydrolase/transferase [Dehalococcoidia bacterium]
MPSKPNILFIESDQHNPAVMGCSGAPVIRTPNLDALAARGIVFDNTYCASPICVPSRASMLTGQHPYRNEVWTNTQSLHPGIPTFAHALGAAGYMPVQIGRMHFNGPDQLHGFTERHVGDHGPNHLGADEVDHGDLKGTQGPNRISLKLSGPGLNAYQVHDENVAARTVEYIDQYAAGDNGRPFCLAVGFMLPHQPFVATKADYDSYRGKVPQPANPRPFEDETHPYLKWWKSHAGLEDVTPEEIERCRTAYYGLVTRLDALIGDIFDTLARHGMLENTLVVYTADHGEQIGEKGLWWKQTFYEDSVKVPAIVSWPARLPQGLHVNRVTSQLDLNATMLDAAGAPALPHSTGRSLQLLIEDPASDDWHDIAFSEYCTEPGDPAHSDGDRTWQNRMVRAGEWKLNYYHGMPSQLFNLADDPGEMNDLIDAPEHADVAMRLAKLLLDDWNPEQVDAQIRKQTADLGILVPWAKQTMPADTVRWDLKPNWDYLDTENPSTGV